MPTQKEAQKIIKETFAPIIGQTLAKKRIESAILGALADGGFFAPKLIVGPAGLGKSRLIEAIVFLLRVILGTRSAKFDSGEACGTKVAFVEDCLVPHFHGKKCALVVDEFHEANVKVRGLFRSLLNPTTARRTHTITAHGDYEVTYDPALNTMILATNKIDQIDTALLSRLDRIDLALYTDEEMEAILHQALETQGITFNDNTLRTIAECNRGTARDVVHWSNAIREYLAIKGKKTINKADVVEIVRNRETFPLGITANELKTLLALEQFGEMQLKELAARNIVDVKEQNANEKYLLQRRLVCIEGKRRLSPEGRAFLGMLRKQKYIGSVD